MSCTASWVVRGGGEKTRKTVVAVLVTFMFTLVSALSVPSASAKSDDAPLVCTLELELIWSPLSWVGTLTGDITGTIVIMEGPATLGGVIEHFNEEFTITTSDGVVIKGWDSGVYNYVKTYMFMANGMVTEASSPDWQWLVGYQLHEMGRTTPLIMGGEVHATGTMMLTAP